MSRMRPRGTPGIALILSLLGLAHGQASPSQSALSAAAATASSSEIVSVPDASDKTLDPASLIPDLSPLPNAKASLIGGTIDKLDRVRDQITVRIFGGGKMTICFDPRTRIYDDGRPAAASDLRRGDRIYLDTILDGSTVFARNIRLRTAAAATGASDGIVLSYREDKRELTLRDVLSPQPLKIHLTSQTQVIHGEKSVSASSLEPGTLVAVSFSPQGSGRDVAQRVSILAVPGASFTFAGRVTGLDLSTGLLVLISDTDGKTYEIHMDSAAIAASGDLHPGANVTTEASFDGSRYVARALTINPR